MLVLALHGCVPPRPPTALEACELATLQALTRALEVCEAEYDGASTPEQYEDIRARCDLLDRAAAAAEDGSAAGLCEAVTSQVSQ